MAFFKAYNESSEFRIKSLKEFKPRSIKLENALRKLGSFDKSVTLISVNDSAVDSECYIVDNENKEFHFNAATYSNYSDLDTYEIKEIKNGKYIIYNFIDKDYDMVSYGYTGDSYNIDVKHNLNRPTNIRLNIGKLEYRLCYNPIKEEENINDELASKLLLEKDDMTFTKFYNICSSIIDIDKCYSYSLYLTKENKEIGKITYSRGKINEFSTTDYYEDSTKITTLNEDGSITVSTIINENKNIDDVSKEYQKIIKRKM